MTRLGGIGRAIGVVTAVCVASALTGCGSYLPSQGPTLQAVVDSSTKPVPAFALVELCDPVLDILAHWAPPSFYGTFGDHRPPVEQTIGIGDSVQVTVWEAAAGGLFSTPVTSTNQPGARSAVIPEQTVTQDGAITMPYAGRINVIGRTPPQVEKIIVQRLTGKAIEPQALVTVTKDYSNTVTVVGDALKQGNRIPLNVRGDRILTVIAEAGGIITPVPQTYIELSRSGRTVRLPMQALVSNPRENIYARPSDVVTVVHYVSTVTAVGATGNNAPLPFNDITMNLEEAVAESGGLVDQRSDPAGVFVLRYEPADIARLLPGIPPNLVGASLVPVAYHINMRDPAAFFAARRFAMRDKDILFVSNSPSTELTKVLQMVDLVTSPVYSAGSVATSGASLAR